MKETKDADLLRKRGWKDGQRWQRKASNEQLSNLEHATKKMGKTWVDKCAKLRFLSPSAFVFMVIGSDHVVVDRDATDLSGLIEKLSRKFWNDEVEPSHGRVDAIEYLTAFCRGAMADPVLSIP